MLVDCQPDAPDRPPEWRWLLAAGLRDGLVRPRRRKLDPWVGRAVRLQDRLAAPDGDDPGIGLARGDRAVLRAHQIWRDGDPRLRRVLEARALAGQPVGAIAALCGLPITVVQAYERLFFDVRDRLVAPDYIAAVVIGHPLHDGLAASNIDPTLKAYAYWGGPYVLDALIDVLGVGDAGGVAATYAATAEGPLARSIRMAILARSIPVTGRGAPCLIRLHARLLEVEREAAADVAIAGPIRATIEPLPADRPGGQGGPMTPPVSALADGATLGLDHYRNGPPAGAGATVPFAGAAPARPGPSVRRTA